MLPIFEYPNDARYVKTLLGIKHKDVHGCSVTGVMYIGVNRYLIYMVDIFSEITVQVKFGVLLLNIINK